MPRRRNMGGTVPSVTTKASERCCSAEEFRRLKGDLTGEALIAAMQASPHPDIDIEPSRTPMPVRRIIL